MAILNLSAKQTAENGIAYKFSKDHKFFIKRSKTSEGFEVYLFENSQRNEKLIIQREIFDRFRSTLKSISDNLLQNSGSIVDLERRIFFKNLDFYRIRPAVDDAKMLVIQELVKQPGSGGYLTIPLDGLAGLVAVFYHPKLQHTNDVFDRLVRYHRLFHFSFTDASESITSGLSLRKDVLSQIDEYVPALGSKAHEIDGAQTAQGDYSDGLETSALSSRANKVNKTAVSKFKSRLGQRDGSQLYDVDYATLFQSGKSGEIEKQPKAADDQRG